jgi:hypothetical protein
MTKESVFHISSILVMSQSPIRSSISLTSVSLHDIAELAKLWGGKIGITFKEGQAGSMISIQGSFNNCEFWAHHHTTVLAGNLQYHAFLGDLFLVEPETNLTVIDDQYLIISDAS